MAKCSKRLFCLFCLPSFLSLGSSAYKKSAEYLGLSDNLFIFAPTKKNSV